MDHTAERNMRTTGEMMVTTLIHANLPKKAWGWAALHACEVINRSTESYASNKAAGTPSNFSRLERWKGIPLPTQTKGLFPFGCLAFKHIPGVLRTKLEAHATPCVYLGLDASSRAFLVGSLYDLHTSVSVEVTFFENIFPFRKSKQESSPSTLLWDSNHSLAITDPRLGVFEDTTQDAPLAAHSTDKINANVVPSGLLPSAPTIESGDDKTPLESKVSKPQDFWKNVLAEHAPTSETAIDAPVVVHAPPAPVLRRSARLTTNKPQFVKNTVGVSNNNSTDTMQLLVSPFEENLLTDPEEATMLQCVSEATLDSITPRGAKQAIQSPLSHMWLAAMNREKSCHIKNLTFGDPTQPPEGAKIIPADWVFRVKYRGGPIDVKTLSDANFKARVVMRGQYMQEGLQFNDTFAPVAKPASLRAVFAVAAKFKCLLISGDVETAFLTAKMDCEVWVRLPPYWGNRDDVITDQNPYSPCLLLKGVPGIPQGSRLFYETFSAHLLSLGYTPLQADKCVFINPGLKQRNVVLVWVDDFIFMCEDEEASKQFIKDIRKAFNVPNAGKLVSFLGMKIQRDIEARRLFFSQESSVEVLLERAKLSDCNPVSTPCVSGAVFTREDCPPLPNASSTEFRGLIALANFISCWSRPDITFVVNKLCKFMSNPGEAHWRMLKHLLRYLAGTRNLGIVYDFAKPSSFKLHAYVDASYADCPDTSRSTLAYCFFFEGAILSWYSKLNTYVTTCTNHSEYNALALGCKEAEWMMLLFNQLVPEHTFTPLPMLIDNSGVISMVYNPVDHQSNKHVRISCHYSRELVTNKVIIPQRVPSDANLADIFTKPLGLEPFKKLSSHFMAQPTSAIALMLQAENSDSEDDDFRKEWPYLNVLKKNLKASSHTTTENGTYSSGRAKFTVSFLDDKGELISRHDAMQLKSRAGKHYFVCKKDPMVAPTKDVAIGLSQITVAPPKPTQTCSTCNLVNNVNFSMIKCLSCNNGKIIWSCGCTVDEVPIAVEPSSETKKTPSPTNRPRRALNQRSWTEKIRYQGPIKRSMLYHLLDCPHAPEANTIASVDFANAYSMIAAPCCKK